MWPPCDPPGEVRAAQPVLCGPATASPGQHGGCAECRSGDRREAQVARHGKKKGDVASGALTTSLNLMVSNTHRSRMRALPSLSLSAQEREPARARTWYGHTGSHSVRQQQVWGGVRWAVVPVWRAGRESSRACGQMKWRQLLCPLSHFFLSRRQAASRRRAPPSAPTHIQRSPGLSAQSPAPHPEEVCGTHTALLRVPTHPPTHPTHTKQTRAASLSPRSPSSPFHGHHGHHRSDLRQGRPPARPPVWRRGGR